MIPPAGTTDKEFSTTQPELVYRPGEFIVKLQKGICFSTPLLQELHEQHQVSKYEILFPDAKDTILDDIYLLHVPKQSEILSIVKDYANCPDVLYAEPNLIGSLCTIPNDTNFSDQWSLKNTGQLGGTPGCDIHAPAAWDIEQGSPDVTIAIIDTGIDATHPELATKLWNNTDEIPNNGLDDDTNGYIDDGYGWDFYYNDSNPDDGYGHGTYCAGIAAAATHNAQGIAGVAWNCRIMSLKIINATGWFDDVKTAQAIKYAADNDAEILSMSFTFLNSSLLHNAIDYAYSKGAFLCAAAGNHNTPNKMYPASYPNVTAVAATTQNDTRCSPNEWGAGYGSNYGDWVDIAAPGNLIYSTMPTYHVTMNDNGHTQNYTYASGTSAATPMVAGVGALLLSKYPSLTNKEVESLICENVDPYNSTEYIGTGRLNAYKALNALNQPPVADFSWTPHNPDIQQHTFFDASASSDPDGNISVYEWDWDNDGVYDENHTTPDAMHAWASTGWYPVTLQVTDAFGKTGNITKTVQVTAFPQFQITITGGLGITVEITNTGTLNATKIVSTISLTDGFILYGKTKNTTLIGLTVGESKTIVDKPILGFGKTTIHVAVSCAEEVSATQTKTGTVILFFVIGIQ